MKVSPKTDHHARVLKAVAPNCYREVDGYFVWDSSDHIGGFTANDLKVIAEILDRANRMWNEQVIRDLSRPGPDPEVTIWENLTRDWYERQKDDAN